MAMDEARACAGCGKMAALRDGSFCCRACRQREWRARRRRERRLVCASRGADFCPTRSDARFCSNACRFYAYRRRKKIKAAEAKQRADFIASLIG
jgi:hypothetical protein